MATAKVYPIGRVFDVWWEIVDKKPLGSNHYQYTLRNTANGNVVKVNEMTLRKIAREELSVSWVIHNRMEADPVIRQKW